ncbi:MAG TPA: hypothetical protein VMU24_10090 [Candidatus Acidoferrales bacterium]|nr:hypothetical protein [Candidatus Acidoferrales bacterium]
MEYVDPYKKLEDSTADALESMHGGDKSYLKWYAVVNPTHAAQFDAFLGHIDAAHGVVPLEVFESLLGLMLAAHKHVYVSWQHQHQLGGVPLSPFVM